jgi:ferric-dicitrate binding protein FerR (iron transport regulator)
MPSIKKAVAKKAAKSAAKHTAHGTASKLRRDPMRAITLLGLGGLVGALAGWFAGRAATGTASVSTGS